MRGCIIIGHRGAHGLAPENTLLSYNTAIEVGVDMIELDVHQTCDGYLVCIHDYEVDRTTNGTGFVSDLSLKELQQLDAGQNEHIPLLSEVLDLAYDKISVNIELKVLDIEKQVIDLVKEKRMKDHIIVSSFLHGSLQKIHEIDEDMKTAVLINTEISDIVEYVKNLHAIALNPIYTMVTPELVTQAHEQKIHLYPWTVNDPKIMLDFAKLGIDGIITDFPNIAIATLKQIF